MEEWFENERFWEDMYMFLFPATRFETAREEIANIMELVEFDGKKVLDLCCGPGRHAHEIAKLGYEVTAVDRSPYLLQKAREYSVPCKDYIEFVEQDMRFFLRENEYDLIINLFTSFGYFEDEADNVKVLENIYINLAKGGKVVLDLAGKEILAKDFHATGLHRIGDAILVENRTILDGWHRIKNDWILLKEGRYETYSFCLTLYSGQELRTILDRIGFQNIALYGDLQKNDYDINARRLVVVAEK